MSKKEIDSHKLKYHPKRVAEWLDKGDCFPIYVEIGLTDRCNHKCIFCALDWLEHGGSTIDKDILLSTLEDMAINGVKSVMFAGEGEPLLHGDCHEFIKHANEQGLEVAVTSNGTLFNKEKAEQCLPYLSWIRFSVDAGTPEAYAEVHQTRPEDFKRVISNINYAAEVKKKEALNVDIGVQALLVPQTAGNIYKLAESVKDAGADNLQIKPYSQHPFSKNSFTSDNNYLDLEPELKSLETEHFKVFFRTNTLLRIIKGPEYDFCHGLPFFALINAKGQVLPCNIFYNNQEFIYGNLYEESFSSIWTGNKRKSILKALAKRDINDCRPACRLDPINKYLHRIKYPEPRDVFI